MGYIEEYLTFVRKHGAPEKYKLWCATYTVACALGRRVWWGDKEFAPEFPNLYIILVGPPSSLRKSTCIKVAQKIVLNSDVIHIMSSGGSKVGHLREFKACQIPYPTPALTYRDIVQGAEAAYFEHELSDLLGGTRADDEFIQWLQTWFDSQPDELPWKYVTVVREKDPDILYKHYLCFLAGTTERYIQTKFPHGCAEEGFGSRVLWIIQKEKDKQRGKPDFDPQEGVALSKRLNWIKHNVKGEVTMTSAAEKYLATYDDIIDDLMTSFHNTAVGGFLARQPTYMKKVAMVRAASETTTTGPLIIEADHLEWAYDQLKDLESGLMHLAEELNADAPTRCAMGIRQVLQQNIVEVVIEGQTRRIPGMVESEVKERFIPKWGPKDYSAAMRILQDQEWALRSGTPFKVNGYKRARRVIFIPKEED